MSNPKPKPEPIQEACSHVGSVRILPGTPIAHIHRHDHSDAIGIMFPAVEGKPIPPGALIVERRGDEGRVIYDPGAPTPSGPSGKPAKVTSAAYRDGWDRTFSDKGIN